MRVLSYILIAATQIVCFTLQPVTPAQNIVKVELVISGDVATPLTLSARDLKNMPRRILRVAVPNENRVNVYEGVAVRELLHRAIVPQEKMLQFRQMTIYIRAEGEHGRIAFSFIDFDPGVQDSEVIVADTLNGLPLGEQKGPLELIEPYKGHVLAVKMLKSLRVLSAAPEGKS